MSKKSGLSKLLEKLRFPQTDEKFNLDYDYKVKADCDFYKRRIYLSRDDERLKEIFAVPAVFKSYTIKEVIIVSNNDGMMVYPRNGEQPAEYQADMFYQDVDFHHPDLEEILKSHNYRLGREVECVGGDYFMVAEPSGNLTINQLKDLLALECVERVEIELDLSHQ